MAFNQGFWNQQSQSSTQVPHFDSTIPPPAIRHPVVPTEHQPQLSSPWTSHPTNFSHFSRPPNYSFNTSPNNVGIPTFSPSYNNNNAPVGVQSNQMSLFSPGNGSNIVPTNTDSLVGYDLLLPGSSSLQAQSTGRNVESNGSYASRGNSGASSHISSADVRSHYVSKQSTNRNNRDEKRREFERSQHSQESSSKTTRDHHRSSRHHDSDRKDRNSSHRTSSYSRDSNRRDDSLRRSDGANKSKLSYDRSDNSSKRLRTGKDYEYSSRKSEPSSSSRSIRESTDIKAKEDEEQGFDEVEEKFEDSSLWTRSSPADLYYEKSADYPNVLIATDKSKSLLDRFNDELVQRGQRVRIAKPKYEKPPKKISPCKKAKEHEHSSDSDSDESSGSEDDDVLAEMETKKKHPDRLHEELWFNDPGEMNDGPLCRCSLKASRFGIRHSIYPGEGHLKTCNPYSNNAGQLYHYRITMSPHTNFVTKKPTVIKHDGHEFIFEGFSLFSHTKLDPNLPQCKVIRFNIEYSIIYVEEKFPENFTVRGLELFTEFLFKEILELVDLQFHAHNDKDGCPIFHLMPRFSRALEDHGKEVLSMNQVLLSFLNSNEDLVSEQQLDHLLSLNMYDWQKYTDEVKGMLVTHPGKKPCSIRVDQLDRETEDQNQAAFPEIVHFGVKPPQLSYAGSPSYQKAWREYVKFRHLLANKPKVSFADRSKLQQKEGVLQDMRTKNNLKRDVTVAVSSKGFYRTGIMCDIVQHAMLIPVLICHLRFHKSLDSLEEEIGYKFQDRYVLQLALTHPSYRENFGTNPDHSRNSLTNCGMRQPEYGDRRIHFMNTRKRGISTLINIMSRFGQNEETASSINHNERLEFLGDAVVEFISSIHLFHTFPDLEEGGLATYRAAIVQNQHLAVLAKNLQLEKYMLFAHGSDLCHDLELKHAMANCFEAVMGALFLDGGIEVADTVFANTLFPDADLRSIWVIYPQHVLQEQEPNGDRKWIESVPLLQKLTKFEKSIGIEFTHIRLLARSFTMRSLGYNHLTLGSNQRLEFLGDTVLQLIASDYLYKFFPEHHEGHLSLLRSSLVNNRTQAVVCEDIGMIEYAINSSPKAELKTKDKADLLEAFLGALYVDKDLDYCTVFCHVCFFPRLQDFIMNQDWNDPKSKLQQCCLTLRSMDGGEPDIPVYKVIEKKGPTNTRIYIVAVYFRGKRLSKGSGHSIQQAEMDAANNALASSKELFPQLIHQKKVIERSLNHFKN